MVTYDVLPKGSYIIKHLHIHGNVTDAMFLEMESTLSLRLSEKPT